MRGQLNQNPVIRTQANEIRCLRRCRVRHNLLPAFQLEAVGGVRQKFEYRCFHRFGGHNSLYGRVNTHGPFAVTATQCSK